VVGLGPAIHEIATDHLPRRSLKMADGWVYIMTNPPNGTLYVGVSDNLARRVWEHRHGLENPVDPGTQSDRQDLYDRLG
jgi:hypothetical protein